MDEERRTLVRRLAADPQDPVAGPALARLLARAAQPTGDLPQGTAVLVLRASAPRPGFAWRKAMDRAIGRVGWVRSRAQDGLSVEIDVPDVGRFHVGHASVVALPELGRRQSSGTFPALDGTVGPVRTGRTMEDLRRLGSRLVQDEPGPLGPDGFTHAQRLLFAAVPANEGIPLSQVATDAGFVPENNRSVQSAFAFLYPMARQNPRARCPLVTIEAPVLLPGAVIPAPLDSGGDWTISDFWVAREESAALLTDGLPYCVVAGLKTEDYESPPHAPAEVADALIKLLSNPRAGLDEIFMIEGPDFPGGGEVGSRGDVGRLYATGTGQLRLRASIGLKAPARIVFETPWPDDAPELFAQLVRDAVDAGRLDGVTLGKDEGALMVELERGVNSERLGAVKQALEELLPLEQAVHYKLPAPLVPWLRSFIEEKRRAGLDDREIRRRILEGRRVAGDRRKTKVF
ncbi:MAG TPA: DNA gyrase subunit A [Planctomycetota bacterium]|nr:DNA gyrase subunit A [Planctomycetota bacterium]